MVSHRVLAPGHTGKSWLIPVLLQLLLLFPHEVARNELT